MQRQRRRDTGAEVAVRRAAWRRGLRYRVDMAPLGGRRRADMVFTRARVVVFVDGCFWHSCPLHGTTPKANRLWWEAKLGANTKRDRDTDASLTAAGWRVMRFWEHEEPEVVAEAIETVVRQASRMVTPLHR